MPEHAERAHTAAPTLSGPVKWFDRDKGFGFVLLGRPPRDAFLHITVLNRAGHGPVNQGDRISCTVLTGERGLSVNEILAVHPVGGDGGAPVEHGVVQLIGRVKFFDLERGYGFIRDDAGREIFVGSKLLKRLGLAPLRADQMVRVSAVPGDRGLVAETLTFLP